MASKLDELIEQIDPSRNLESVSADVDRAFNSFPMQRATVATWDEYENYLTDFYIHIEKNVLKSATIPPDSKSFFWAKCSNLLNDHFGYNGVKEAFRMANTGKDGGLYEVLKIIARRMAETYAHSEILGRVSRYWDSLTNEEKLAAPKEYIRKYGHILPSEISEGAAIKYALFFPKFLQEHPNIVRNLRRETSKHT
jgi:hypothetical protein